MGLSLIDITVQNILQDGFNNLKDKPELIDDIFENYKQPHLNKMLGQKEIDKIKEYLADNHIPVRLGLGVTPTEFPSISVNLSGSSEDTSHTFFGDHAGFDEQEIEPRTIVAKFVPQAYDKISRIITVSDDIDLSLVRPAHRLEDKNKNRYVIIMVAVDGYNGLQFEVGDDQDEPDFDTCEIVSFIETRKRKIGATAFWTEITIICASHGSPNVAVWLFNIIKYILLRYKQAIEERCLSLITFSVADLNRQAQNFPENVFARALSLRVRTQEIWYEDDEQQIDTLTADVTVDDGTED